MLTNSVIYEILKDWYGTKNVNVN